MALTSGLRRRQVASDLGVGFSTLAKWIQKSRPGDLPTKKIIGFQAFFQKSKAGWAWGTVLLEYQISDNSTLSNDFTVRWDSERTKIENIFAITSKIIGSLSGRASVDARYNTNPPGTLFKKTDTITKVALVYSF